MLDPVRLMRGSSAPIDSPASPVIRSTFCPSCFFGFCADAEAEVELAEIPSKYAFRSLMGDGERVYPCVCPSPWSGRLNAVPVTCVERG